jgi:deoxyadenosine/deoxycytidine kinase
MESQGWISLEANIAAGKSTLQTLLLPKLEALFGGEGAVARVDEPVHVWEANRVLEHSYKDPRAWLFPAQCHFFKTRIDEFRAQYARNPQARVFFSERSVYSDHLFWNTQDVLGRVDKDMVPIYHDMWCLWQELLPIARPTLIVYLDTKLDGCMDRMGERARAAEEGVPRTYMQALHEQHERAFGGTHALMPDETRVPVLRVDGNPDFRYDDAHVDTIAQSIYDAYQHAIVTH